MKTLILIFCVLFFFSPILLLPQSPSYKISGKINIGGKGWWDYAAIDKPSDRLFVSHADKVHIIDLKTNKIIGEIDHLNGVHGIVFADKYGKGFISNGRSDSVTVFDLNTLKKIDGIKVTGKDPDAIVYDRFSKRVFTMNGRSADITAIDAKTDQIAGTIKLSGSPEFCVSNDKGLIFVNLENKNQIEEFNPITLKTVKTLSLFPGEGPSGLAMDRVNNILFSGCHNKLMVVLNASTGKIITTLPIGGHVDACAFDPGDKLAFSSNGEGNLTVIREISHAKFKVVNNVKTEKGFRTMALNTADHKIYLPGMVQGGQNSKKFGVLILEKN